MTTASKAPWHVPDGEDPIAKEENEPGEKFCTHCGVRKKLEEFHKDEQKPDGYRDVCKLCRASINEDKKRYERDRRLQEIEQQNLNALEKMSSIGGSFSPDVTELLESIMRPFGGVHGYAKNLYATYLAAEPGSMKRIRMHEMIVRLVNNVTQMGLAERKLDMMDEKDLRNIMQTHLLEYQESNNLTKEEVIDIIVEEAHVENPGQS